MNFSRFCSRTLVFSVNTILITSDYRQHTQIHKSIIYITRQRHWVRSNKGCVEKNRWKQDVGHKHRGNSSKRMKNNSHYQWKEFMPKKRFVWLMILSAMCLKKGGNLLVLLNFKSFPRLDRHSFYSQTLLKSIFCASSNLVFFCISALVLLISSTCVFLSFIQV